MKLAEKKCAACEGDAPKIARDQANQMLKELNGWRIIDGGKLAKSFSFSNFAGAMDLANRIAGLAEQEGHHPDLLVRWGELQVTIWTHAVGGLTENDFILAAKIDRLAK